MDTLFYWAGVFALGFVVWWLMLRHVLHGLSEAISASIHITKLDFADLDPNKINVEIAKHYSNWDKLWIVPQHFRNVLFREMINHWKYY